MPIVRPIYRGLKQIFETLFSKSGSSFRRVGAGGVSCAGHVVAGVPVAAAERRRRGAAAGDRARLGVHAVHAQSDHGFFFYVPRRDVIELEIPVEAAMTLLMSAGMVQPGGNGDQQKKLAALADARVPPLRSRPRVTRRPQRRSELVYPARISRIASSRSNR